MDKVDNNLIMYVQYDHKIKMMCKLQNNKLYYLVKSRKIENVMAQTPSVRRTIFLNLFSACTQSVIHHSSSALLSLVTLLSRSRSCPKNSDFVDQFFSKNFQNIYRQVSLIDY